MFLCPKKYLSVKMVRRYTFIFGKIICKYTFFYRMKPSYISSRTGSEHRARTPVVQLAMSAAADSETEDSRALLSAGKTNVGVLDNAAWSMLNMFVVQNLLHRLGRKRRDLPHTSVSVPLRVKIEGKGRKKTRFIRCVSCVAKFEINR